MNPVGLAAALAAFLGIWFGHVAVRKIEYLSPTIWLPTVLAVLAGLSLAVFSSFTANRALSAVLGILGTTVLWDALEFTRQQQRVRRGHAPANPHNPRHARFLAEGRATHLDLLKRDPLGRQVSPAEAVRLVQER